MVPPDSKIKKWWNYAVVLLVMYNSLFIPFVLGYSRYNPNEGNLYFYDMENDHLILYCLVVDYLVDMFFVADIVLTFRTTYFDADNELVLDKKLIANNYLRGAFPVFAPYYLSISAPFFLVFTYFWLLPQVDLLATVPFEIIGLLYHGKLDLGFKILRLLRLTKVIRQLDVHNNVSFPAATISDAHGLSMRTVALVLRQHIPTESSTLWSGVMCADS